MSNKKVIALDISSSRRGGPYVACKNIIGSKLKDEYDFKEIVYDNKLGRFISWKRILNLKSQLRQIKPDAIIITGLQLSCFHVCVASLLAGVKSRIITIHGSSTEALSLSTAQRIALYIIEFLSLLMCTSFYGVSKYASNLSAAKWFKRKNKGHVYNLPTMANKVGNVTRKSLKIADNDIVVSTSGRIIREKGFAVLSETIKMIDRSDVKFLIIGDGDYLNDMKAELSQQVEDHRVIFIGYTENVYQYLNVSDIFVLPTLHETLSVSLLEAAAVKLPLVSTNVGGVPEVIVNGLNGVLVEPNDAYAIKKALERLADNQKLRVDMGDKAFERLNAVFSQTQSMDMLNSIIKDDLNRK